VPGLFVVRYSISSQLSGIWDKREQCGWLSCWQKTPNVKIEIKSLCMGLAVVRVWKMLACELM
jgi:hypothetical protein